MFVMIRVLPSRSLTGSPFCCLHRGVNLPGFNHENLNFSYSDLTELQANSENYRRAVMGDTCDRRSGRKEGNRTNGFTQEQMIVPQQTTMSYISTTTENVVDNYNENDLKIVRDISKTLAKDIVWNYVGRKASKPPNSHAATLRRTVHEIMEKHEILFKSIVNKLDIDENNGYSTFVNVVEEMFVDSEKNWGRLVSVYAFAASLAKFARCKGMADRYVDNIIELSGNYVANKLGKWILSQGGWDAFDACFPEPQETEKQLWRGLLFTVFGLGALATLAAVR